MRTFKRWLFRIFFGFDPEVIADIAKQQIYLQSDYIDVLKVLVDIKDLAILTSTQTGGTGWTDTVQGAIKNLNERINEINTILSNHHDILAELYVEEEVKTTDLEINSKIKTN